MVIRFASFSMGQIGKICYLLMISLCFCCLCRSDGGLPKRVACDFCEPSIAARALPVHPETHLRLCRGVLATAASRGQRNWSGCNLLSRYSCSQTNWFTCLPAVFIRPFAFEVRVCCGVSSSTFLKKQEVEMPFLEEEYCVVRAAKEISPNGDVFWWVPYYLVGKMQAMQPALRFKSICKELGVEGGTSETVSCFSNGNSVMFHLSLSWQKVSSFGKNRSSTAGFGMVLQLSHGTLKSFVPPA